MLLHGKICYRRFATIIFNYLKSAGSYSVIKILFAYVVTLGMRHRKKTMKHGTFSFLTVYRNDASMVFHNLATDSKPYSRTVPVLLCM